MTRNIICTKHSMRYKNARRGGNASMQKKRLSCIITLLCNNDHDDRGKNNGEK